MRHLLHFAAWLFSAWATLANAGETARLASLPSRAVIPRCLLSIKDEVPVPAKEAGVLVELQASEGMQVEKGQLLGRVDDKQSRMEKRVAEIEMKSAREQAENDVDVRYSNAAAKVAEQEYENAVDANRRVRGTFPPSEVRQLRLAWQRAVLEIEQAESRRRIAGFTSDSRAAEVEAADQAIARRRIEAPIDGEVVNVFAKLGQWVNPGDAVLRIVDLSTLRVEGFLNAADFDPGEVAGSPVTVEVELARGRRIRTEGKIVYVSPLVHAGGQYRVWAEVENRRENGSWLLRPGLTAAMTIAVR